MTRVLAIGHLRALDALTLPQACLPVDACTCLFCVSCVRAAVVLHLLHANCVMPGGEACVTHLGRLV